MVMGDLILQEGKVLGAKSGEWGLLARLHHFGFTHTAIQPTNTQYNKCYLKAQSSSKSQKNVTKNISSNGSQIDTRNMYKMYKK